MTYPIAVSRAGGVLLGNTVVCDGHEIDRQTRIQTHIHDDHMIDFHRSKGVVDLIVCSDATKRLLIAEFDADLKHRPDIVGAEFGVPVEVSEGAITLISSGRMLGAAQVVLQTNSGLRLGYSGDFEWPLAQPIQVDALVLDSSYGSSTMERLYSQDDVDFAFVELVLRRLRFGPVHIIAYRGTIQRALPLLAGRVEVPILASPKLVKEINVYRHFGYKIDPICPTSGDEARRAMDDNSYIRFYGSGDKRPKLGEQTQIRLSAFMSEPTFPVRAWNAYSYAVSMSDHADFDGTLSYIEATGAKYVVTDNTRRFGISLAQSVRSRLGIPSSASPL